MSCGHCVASITRAVQALDKSANVTVDLRAGRVTVQSSLGENEVRQAIADAGYPVLEKKPA